MLAAVSALAAQNIGAGKHDRAAKTLQYSILITSVYGIIISLIVQFTAPHILQTFTGDDTVVLLGTQYIHSYIWDCIFAGIHFSFTGYFCAYGNPILVLSTISLPLFWSVSRDLIWLPDIFPIRCSLWEWQRRQVLCFRF